MRSTSSSTLHHASRVGLAALLAVSALAFAGPLDPPAGPIAPTLKTLAEVEPRTAINAANTPGDATCLFKITKPGSYYLTANLSGVAGKHGIVIAVRDVTIDLSGFTMEGLNTSGSGIIASVLNLDNITIQNGDIVHWGVAGIDLVTSSAIRSTVRNVRASNNVSQGIRLYNNSMIQDCAADFNGGVGIDGYSRMTVTRCQASNNSDAGIDLSNESIVSDCSTSSNSGRGISVGVHSSVTGCISASNFRVGFAIQGQGIISGNNASNNGLDGFSGGIYVLGTDTRVEGNNCSANARGIDVSGAGNIIIRNTCSGNSTNWNIVPGNSVAPIIVSATNAALISGNSYSGSLGSTDPSANFTY